MFPEADIYISEWGPWAMSMLNREDFSTLAITEEARTEYERQSAIWHKAYEKGEEARYA